MPKLFPVSNVQQSWNYVLFVENRIRGSINDNFGGSPVLYLMQHPNSGTKVDLMHIKSGEIPKNALASVTV